MDKENRNCDLAMIERGVVIDADDGLYTIRSYGRDGLITPGIPVISGHVHSFAEGDKVYFFLFDDGNGAVIGKFE